MPVSTAKDLAVAMLSELRHGAERSTKIYEELGQAAQNQQIMEALNARQLISSQIVHRLDECFKLLGEKPGKVNLKMHEVFLEDFRRELNEMQSPIARKMFVLAKANHLAHLQEASYTVLIAAADSFGHPAVGLLLESCLADKMAFAERTRRTIREIVEQKIAAA
jgi:ferritin-like metal-binding protein YciE